MATLYFMGKIDSSINIATASIRLAQLFKTDNTAHFANWFNGTKIIIKDNITIDEARQYQSLFAQQGIFLEIEAPELSSSAPAFNPQIINPSVGSPNSGFYAPNTPYAETYYDEEISEEEEDLSLGFWAKFHKKYFSLKGRLSPIQYFSRTLLLALWMIPFFAIFFIAFFILIYLLGESDKLAFILGAIAVFTIIMAIFLTFIPLLARRLHDLNLSAWWILTIIILPISLVRNFPSIGLLNDLIIPISIMLICLKKGNADDNRFGKAPKPNTKREKICAYIMIGLQIICILFNIFIAPRFIM